MPAPGDITSELGLPEDFSGKVLYIHSCGGKYRNVIVLDGTSVVAYLEDGTTQTLVENVNETNDVNAIGNTLILSTGDKLHYAIYNNEVYEYLGTDIPVPNLQIISDPRLDLLDLSEEKQNWLDYVAGENWTSSLSEIPDYDDAKADSYLPDDFKVTGDDITVKKIAAAFDLVQTAGLGLKEPRFIRYAVRLYDGSYINISPPIMVGAATWRDRIKFTAKTTATVSDYVITYSCRGDYTYTRGYFVRLLRLNSRITLSKWKDLIQSIDVFTTIPVSFYPNAGCAGKIKTSETTDSSNRTVTTYDLILDPYNETRQKEIMLSQTDYRLLKRYSLDEYAAISSDGELIREELFDSDRLALQESLTASDYRSQHRLGGERMMTYNNRILLDGVKRILPRGYDYVNGAVLDKSTVASSIKSSEVSYWYITYHIRGSNGETLHIRAHDSYGDERMGIAPRVTQKVSKYYTYNGVPHVTDTESVYITPVPFSWISYPDSRCFAVDILLVKQEPSGSISSHWRNNIPMEASDTGDFAYFLNPRLNLLEYVKAGTDKNPGIEENIIESLPNYLAQSDVSNPFYFPPTGLQAFTSSIIGIATTTKALSQGQFGQFPLYVFTKDGIWAMETGSDGSFVSKKPLSRDVALSPECITPIEQAIVFTTDKGVMLLSGSDIKNISPFMTGKHYCVDDRVGQMVGRQEKFAPLLTSVTDATPFMAFMKSARCAYDYTGQRLIFFNNDEVYQYVYKIDTDTWHKMSLADSTLPTNVHYVWLTVYDSSNADWQGLREFFVGNGMTAFKPAEEWTADYFPEGTEVLIGYMAEYNYLILENFDDGTRWNIQGSVKVEFMDCSYSVLNSYPDCWVGRISGTKSQVLNFSTSFNTDEVTPLKGIVVTRPFDLDEADVRKVITHIRIRGDFNREDVKYVLLASMDGHHWGVLPSLRGGSYKLFRMVLFCDLEAYERISYIDVEYETRFTNRMR